MVLRKRPPEPDEEAVAEDNARQSRAVIGIVLIAILVIGAAFLIEALERDSAIDDCLMAGRHDCDSMVPATNSN